MHIWKIKAENFSNVLNNINAHVQEAEPLPSTEHDTKVHHVQTAEEQWYDNDYIIDNNVIIINDVIIINEINDKKFLFREPKVKRDIYAGRKIYEQSLIS